MKEFKKIWKCNGDLNTIQERKKKNFEVFNKSRKDKRSQIFDSQRELLNECFIGGKLKKKKIFFIHLQIC